MKRIFTVLGFSLCSSFAFSAAITGISADGSETVFDLEDVRSIKFAPQKAGDKGYSTIVFGAKEEVTDVNDGNPSIVPIMIYPNPVSEYITIVGAEETDEVVVTDMRGSVVIRTNGSKVDVVALPQGGYLLTVQGKTVRFVKK